MSTKIYWFFTLLAALGIGVLTAWAGYSVEIDLGEQKAYLMEDGHAVIETAICTGRYGHLTPKGTFHIMLKELNHVSSIYGKIIDREGNAVVLDADVDMATPIGTRFVNAPMNYYMEFAPGIGMHAGYLPGYPASHGCVRLAHDYAIAFFQAISVGTPVTVFGTTPRVRQYQVQNEPWNQQAAQPQQTPQRKRKFLFGLFGF